MASEQPRGALLAQSGVKLRIPSLYRGAGIAASVSAVLLGIGGGLLWEWSAQPDELSPVGQSTEWRITNGDGVATDWRICSLELFSDEYCLDAIDLTSATPVSSSQVPAGFRDNSCESVWSSGKQKDAYIGWSLPKAVTVGCIRATPFSEVTGCSFSWMCDPLSDVCESGVQCDSCCDSDTVEYNIKKVKLQSKQGHGFRTVITRDYEDAMELSHELATYDGAPLMNNAKIVLLIAWMFFFIFGGLGLLLVAPVLLSALSSLRTKMTKLQGHIDAGEACVCEATDAQWADFVEDHWGPKGAMRRAEHGLVFVLAGGLILGAGGMLLLKLKSLLRGVELSWSWCAIIMLPVGVLLALVICVAEKVARRRRYAQCKRGKFPVVLGPESLYFGGVFVHGEGATSNCRVVQTQFLRAPEKGCCIVVTYVIKAKTETTKKVTAPISEAHLPQAKAFVARHRAFYKPALRRTQVGNAARAAPHAEETEENLEGGAGGV